MNNFEFYCPTKMIFGKGSIAKLGELIDTNKKVLMIYGGGSIKKNGVYDQVKNALKNHTVFEFSGIEPNPTYETCMKAVEIVKKENIDFLLAVGGGSTLDGTKFIAVASKYQGEEPYDLISQDLPFYEALPLGSVMTLPATGSEMNCASVVSRTSTQEKFAMRNPSVYPQFSIIDPETTYSLPIEQVRNGIVDTFVHVMELYATYDVNTPLQDSWALGLIKTLIQEAPKVLKNNEDYDAKANICWCATCGLNYWLAVGTIQDWSTHRIGHELTAFYGQGYLAGRGQPLRRVHDLILLLDECTELHPSFGRLADAAAMLTPIPLSRWPTGVQCTSLNTRNAKATASPAYSRPTTASRARCDRASVGHSRCSRCNRARRP